MAMTKEEWLNWGVEDLTLPSGAVVRIRKSSINSLIGAGAIPNDVLKVAMTMARRAAGQEQAPEEPEPEVVAGALRLRVAQVLASLKDPKITEEEFNQLPADDQQALLDYVAGDEQSDEPKAEEAMTEVASAVVDFTELT